jgi:predicted transcriptional regulator
MSKVSLSVENERYLQAKVDAGCFASIDDAVNSLLQREKYWDDSVREKVLAGLADLEAGRYTDYDDESLKAFFDELISQTETTIIDCTP